VGSHVVANLYTGSERDMSFENVNRNKQFNFQINRVLTYGDIACDRTKVIEKTATIRNISEWVIAWTELGESAERCHEHLKAAYYYRMAEFFLTKSDTRKEDLYKKCISHFYNAFDNELHLTYEKYEIPFENGSLNCIKLPANNQHRTILVCGGYDSFIEEFVLQVSAFTARGYDVILFEGPGQGKCLRQKMYFRYDYEKPTTAVIDFFKLDSCAMVGISWGGYFALRAAAFEKRITAAVAYDVMYNGFEVMTNVFPKPLCGIFRTAYKNRNAKLMNFLIGKITRRSIIANWAISQGLYITGTDTPYDFYKELSKHTLEGITKLITQNILLLAGSKDHYIPQNQFMQLKDNLPNAKTLTARMFTEAEGGEQHCQIGNHMLAVNTIIDWLDAI
jgi:pimeloyl-ACP methyl ester carboxylesterase